MLFVCHPKILHLSIVSQEKLKTMLMQNFGATNKEHYGMLWYILEWSIIGIINMPEQFQKNRWSRSP